MVCERRVGRVDEARAGAPGSQAERNVAVGDAVTLVVATDALEQVSTDHLAGAHHGKVVTVDVGRPERPPGTLRKAVEDQPAHVHVHTDHHPRVLDQTIGVKELGPHDADARELGEADHLLEPAGIADLDVVVEEEEQLAARRPRPGVARRRVVEVALEGHDRREAIAAQLVVELVYSRIQAEGVDEDDLLARIARPPQHTVDALLDELGLVARRDDDRHERRIDHRPDGALRAVRLRLDVRGEPAPVEVLGERAPVERSLRIVRRGPGGRRRRATVAEDLRDVSDALGALREAQRDVPFLGALELGTEPADLSQAVPPDGGQPPEVVVREEQLRRPVGLERRRASEAPALRELVFVRIDDVRVRILLQEPGDLVERVGRQDVAGIEHGDVFPGSELGCDHARLPLARVRADCGPPHLMFGGRQTCEDLFHVGRCGRTVRETELPVRVGLRAHACERVPQLSHALRRHGDHYADRWPLSGRARPYLLGAEVCRRRLALADPLLVVRIGTPGQAQIVPDDRERLPESARTVGPHRPAHEANPPPTCRPLRRRRLQYRPQNHDHRGRAPSL